MDLGERAIGVLLAQRRTQDEERKAWGETFADHGLVFAREDGNPLGLIRRDPNPPLGDGLDVSAVVTDFALMFTFRAFHEADHTRAGGYTQRFGYVPADDLEHARHHIWRRWPRLAPPEFRQRMERAAAADAAVATTRPRDPAPVLVVPRTGGEQR